ncbi:MAG: ABC transporter permease [Erysipelotrichaceae bacterium]|nr:ABC transporter permease [Erysipelotrichaceae bacterium]
MNKLFYQKLAFTNIKKNSKTYIPFLLTCIITIALFYDICSLAGNSGLDSMPGAGEMRMMLILGTYVVGFFAIIFLFYTNSFLMKRRKKEFGLFNILGMEKRHVSLIIAFETLITALISVSLGFLIGISLDKLLFMAISKMFDTNITLGFYISSSAIKSSLILFGLIFLFMYLNSIRQIKLANPIELLHSTEYGEKEPKSKWIMTILGIVCLSIGYYISLTTKNPILAMMLFFGAVILVIIGTYLLFTAGSVTLLKALKKNKKYFYKPNHFISVSGMIYRMKQNAAGLANICILSTMVLVMISTTFSLWIGMEDLTTQRYPREIVAYIDANEKDIQTMRDVSKQLLKDKNLEKENILDYRYVEFAGYQEEQSILTDRENIYANMTGAICTVMVTDLDDYNQSMHTNYTLNDNEILLYGKRKEFGYDEFEVFDYKFKVKEQVDEFMGNGNAAANVSSGYFIVVKDETIVNDIYESQKEVYGEHSSNLYDYYGFDIDASKSEIEEYYDSYTKALEDAGIEGYDVECKTVSYAGFMALYGGFLFIGIFLSVLFIMAAILIIYYKQITEGYEDKERFEIMQKVGMDHKLVKKSINSQVLTVFFLPLVTAVIHLAFAFPIISELLRMLMLSNTQLYIYCTLGCIGVFTLVYILIYSVTAKSYYSIVKRN